MLYFSLHNIWLIHFSPSLVQLKLFPLFFLTQKNKSMHIKSKIKIPKEEWELKITLDNQFYEKG